MNKQALIAIVGAASLLAACGGSDDDAPPPDPLQAVPASATQSSAGLVGYVNSLAAAAGADQAEPIDLSNLDPLPQPDNTEPEALS